MTRTTRMQGMRVSTPAMRGTRGAAVLLAAATALGAASPEEPSRLPPGARPPSERASVETRDAPYGARLVEPLATATPEQRGSVPEVEYTVDPGLEAQIRAVLEAGGVALGHVIAMDPDTGEVYAYVSTDPERFPAEAAYPTASLMKVVTAAALLRHAPRAAERPCRSLGNPYDLREAHLAPGGGKPPTLSDGSDSATAGAGGGGHGSAPTAPEPETWEGSFRRALAISNNQCFARHAVLDLGEAKLREEIRRAGLLDAPAPGHAAGSLEPIETPLDLGNLGSGLAGSAITPLAAARLAALLAHGRLVTPHWLAQRFDPSRDTVEGYDASAAHAVWEPALAQTLREHLRSVTEDGTARRAFRREDGSPRLAPVGVAGKTGTLRGEAPAGLYQWFAGVAPDDAPELAIAAVVLHLDDAERGASASEIAAGVLERVFCDADGGCGAERAGVLRARSHARARWAAELRAARAAARAAATAAEAEAEAEALAERADRLDTPLRPVAGTRLDLPERLRRRRWDGEVVMRIEVGPGGAVVAASVDHSDLPAAFGEYVLGEVRTWRFEPPRRDGRPVSARVLLPIPIRVE